jgi:hypothetical protein
MRELVCSLDLRQRHPVLDQTRGVLVAQVVPPQVDALERLRRLVGPPLVVQPRVSCRRVAMDLQDDGLPHPVEEAIGFADLIAEHARLQRLGVALDIPPQPRRARGYALPNAEVTEHHTLATAATVPCGFTTLAPLLTFGIDVHQVEGVKVRVTSPARTVADSFKFRNRVGLDVAIEALRDYLRTRKGTPDDLWQCAERFPVRNVIPPYGEGLSA